MYIKPGKTFNLSKTSKRALATIVGQHERGVFKREMIQAELAGAIVPKREPRQQPSATATTAGPARQTTSTSSTS